MFPSPHPLHRAFNELAPLSEADFSRLLPHISEKTFRTGDHVFQAGQYCRGVHYVLSGLTGTYQLLDGREMFQAFHAENDFATDVAALSTQEPSEVSMRALEDTRTVYIPRTDLLAMYEVSPAFQAVGRSLLEKLLILQTKLTIRQTTLSARERYEQLLAEEPELLQRVTLQGLSTYLGMSRETLSRIRAKK